MQPSCSWGEPFLQHTYLYHLTRRDHRHNFSLYFYPTYLAHSIGGTTIWRSPLLSFVPQMALSLGTGLFFGREDLPFACFVQTTVFVLFNKVCTSQVRLNYLLTLPNRLIFISIVSVLYVVYVVPSFDFTPFTIEQNSCVSARCDLGGRTGQFKVFGPISPCSSLSSLVFRHYGSLWHTALSF